MDINNELPVLGKCVVKYDDVYAMPQFVQGRLLGGKDSGKTIIIKNIESIDLKDKMLKTYTGQQYKMVGELKRMILLGEDDILEIAMREMEGQEE